MEKQNEGETEIARSTRHPPHRKAKETAHRRHERKRVNLLLPFALRHLLLPTSFCASSLSLSALTEEEEEKIREEKRKKARTERLHRHGSRQTVAVPTTNRSRGDKLVEMSRLVCVALRLSSPPHSSHPF